MTEKFITALKELQSPTINTKYDLQTWQAKATNLISRIYGEDSNQEKQIKQIKFTNYMSISTIGGSGPSTRAGGGNNGKHCERQANELVLSFISDLEEFGLPEPREIEKKGGINISLNQSQNQTVNVNIIWDTIRDELTGKQVKEVEEIINGDDDPESKKKKISDKLKSFGGDVVANVISGLLTNPAIYGM